MLARPTRAPASRSSPSMSWALSAQFWRPRHSITVRLAAPFWYPAWARPANACSIHSARGGGRRAFVARSAIAASGGGRNWPAGSADTEPATLAEPPSNHRHKVGNGGDADHRRAWRQRGNAITKSQSRPHRPDGERPRKGQSPPRVAGKKSRRPRRRGEQAEQEQRPHRLGSLSGNDRQQHQEGDPQGAHANPEAARDPGVDGGEKKRAGERQEGEGARRRDRGGDSSVGCAEAEDRAEQNPHRRGPVRGAGRGGEDREEEDAESQHPRKDRADDDVVGARALAEQPKPDRHQDRRREQADADVDAGGRGRQGAGEGDVAEGVAGEDLAPQNNEVADKAAGERDRGAGQEGVSHELVGEH